MAIPGQDAAESSATPSRRLHPFFRDLGVTVAAQAAVALGGLLLYSLLARETGTAGFASYSLVKQATNFCFPIVTVGLVGGLPRYLALPAEERAAHGGEAYLVGAAAISGVATLAVAMLALLFPEPTAGLFFGDRSRDELVAPFVVLLGGTSLFYVAYGWFRGHLQIRRGSALQVAGLAVLPPLAVIALPNDEVDLMIVLMGAGLGAMSVAAVAVPFGRGLRARAGASLGGAARELFDYGHRRVPGELAQLGLFALVPALAAHVASLTDVAYLSAGQQVLSMLSLATLPIGLVMLPTLTRLWATDRERASAYVGSMSALALHAALFLSVQTVLYADIAVSAWLGSNFDDAADIVRVTVAPAALFVLYMVLRSALDAAEVKSYNSRNNIISLALFAAVAALTLGLDVADEAMCVAIAFAAGVSCQGVLTFLTVHSRFGLDVRDYELRTVLPLALAAAAIGGLARPLIEEAPAAFAWVVVLELALAALYFGALVRAGVGWTRLLRERLVERGGGGD